MLINLPNGIGKIKNKQEIHVCAQDLCITEASNHSNILLPKVQRLNLTFVPALVRACMCVTACACARACVCHIHTH